MANLYRGGNNLLPRPDDLRLDPATGMLRTTHGFSVYDRPDGLDRVGGAFRLGPLPQQLKAIQRGRNPGRFEILPTMPMPIGLYATLLVQIRLTPAGDADSGGEP